MLGFAGTSQYRRNNRLAPLLIGVVIVLVFVLASVGVVTELVGRTSQQDVQKTSEMLVAERTLYGLLVDMQTSQRGFIITGDELFLQPYNDAVQRLPGLWATLEERAASLDAASGTQLQPLTPLVAEMKAAATDWHQTFAQPTIDLVRAGRTGEAAEMVASGVGREMFNTLRDRSNQVNIHLNERFENYSANLTGIRQMELYLLIGVGLLALVSAVLAVIVSRREIALQEEATRAAELASQRLQAIVESLPVPVRLLNAANGDVVLQNHAAERLFPTDEWNSMQVDERLRYYQMTYPDGRPLGPGELPSSRAIAEGQPAREVEIMARIPGHGARSLLVSAVPLRDERGQVSTTAVVLQDVTRMRELDARKDEFIATAAHEIRNPLTALHGYIQLQNRQAQKIEMPPGSVRYLQEMNKLSKRLNALVELLLDASRISLGRLVLDKSPADLVEIARTVVAGAEAIDSGEHKLELVAPDSIKCEVDSTRMEQVLTNLVGNALRYSPEGTTVLVRMEEREGQAHVEVVDNGPGVPEEMRANLFTRYYQSEADRQQANGDGNGGKATGTQRLRRTRGLGIGLHISKEIVQAHAGNIGMTPNPEGGSIFWFTVPVGE